jgi:hypothetical protein
LNPWRGCSSAPLRSCPIDYYTLGHFSKSVPQSSVAVCREQCPRADWRGLHNPRVKRGAGGLQRLGEFKNLSGVAWQGRAFGYTLPPLAGATFLWPATLSPLGPHRIPSTPRRN